MLKYCNTEVLIPQYPPTPTYGNTEILRYCQPSGTFVVPRAGASDAADFRVGEGVPDSQIYLVEG